MSTDATPGSSWDRWKHDAGPHPSDPQPVADGPTPLLGQLTARLDAVEEQLASVSDRVDLVLQALLDANPAEVELDEPADDWAGDEPPVLPALMARLEELQDSLAELPASSQGGGSSRGIAQLEASMRQVAADMSALTEEVGRLRRRVPVRTTPTGTLTPQDVATLVEALTGRLLEAFEVVTDDGPLPPVPAGAPPPATRRGREPLQAKRGR